MNFTQINVGKWMTQRTTYTTKQGLSQVHQSEVIIQKTHDPKIVNSIQLKDKVDIVESYNIQDNIDQKIIYLVYDMSQNYFKQIKNQNLYSVLHHMNKKNHISISTKLGNLCSVEKLWLVNPNLRLGVNIIKKHNKCVAITFSSDIRIM